MMSETIQLLFSLKFIVSAITEGDSKPATDTMVQSCRTKTHETVSLRTLEHLHLMTDMFAQFKCKLLEILHKYFAPQTF